MISQAYADRTADFLFGVAANVEAIRERRQFCWLKDRPVDKEQEDNDE